MITVNIHEAKTKFSKLIARVEDGEEIIIARDGAPVARLVAFSKPLAKRIAGRDRDVFFVPEDFDEPLPPNVLTDFES
jgi:prevent-host-death family protein